MGCHLAGTWPAILPIVSKMECRHCKNEATAFARYADKYVVAAICANCLEKLYGGDQSRFQREVITAALDDHSGTEQPGPAFDDWH